MRSRRFSVALVTAAGVSLSLVSPAVAHADSNNAKPVITKECQAEIDRLAAEHKAAASKPAGGSSFMGPNELFKGILSGYGLSGMPEAPQCQIDAENAAKEKEESQKKKLDPKFEEAMAWISSILGVFAVLMQVGVVAAKANPAILNPLKDALRQANIRF